jgi:hypothetical protein
VTKGKYYIDKRCKIWVDKKLLKNPMKYIYIYQRTKVQKLGSPKIEWVKKITNYIKWKP